MNVRQRSLFDDEPDDRGAPASRSQPVLPVEASATVTRIAGLVPASIRLGTSSWSFPGWTGLVYAPRGGRPESEQRLARDGLPAYASHPLLRTVSLDRTYYAPLTREQFAAYAAQVPEGFRFVVKAPAAFTDPVVRQAGAGMAVGENPTFLDAAAAGATFVRPAFAGLATRAGPLVFQFPPLPRRLLADLPRLVARIAAFMATVRQAARGHAAGEPILAVEIRDPALATPAMAAALLDAGVVPCLAVHARMPPVERQAGAFGLDAAGCCHPLVARWNLHAGREYEEARADYFPFDRLVEEDRASRAALARLAAACAAGGREAFITINNKAEGSAPLSVIRLAEAIVSAAGAPGGRAEAAQKHEG